MSISKHFLNLSVLFFLLIGNGIAYSQNGSDEATKNATTKKFFTLLHYIENYYVDTVDSPQLTEAAIKGMLKELDPHSVYIPPEEVQRMKEPLRGNFEGIGIRFNILKDTILVVSPIPGGPSEKLGIQAGDKIVEIEGENVVGINNSGVRERLRGKKGTEVEIGIHRAGEPELLHFEITRDKIPLNSVQAHYMAAPKVGYIKVNRFSSNTMGEFNKAIRELKEEGMESLVLDLQGNGGGYLKTAIDMVDQFLQKDRLIVYTEGAHFPRQERRTDKKGLFEEGKLVVMIDESSASASEIVSGAIQDWDRGVVVGRRSFGKGLVQRPIDLPDGSVVRLTISRYHTPSGRCIQKPYGESRKDYAKEKYERWESGEVFHADSIDIADSLKYETRIKGRAVYGGGGIIPDIFVPIDTSGSSDYFQKIRRKGILNNFALNYVDDHRQSLQKEYSTVKAFADGFKVDEEIRESLFKEAEKKGIEKDMEGYERSRKFMDLQLKALIARNIWGLNAYYQVFNPARPSYEKAIEILQDGTFEKMDLAKTR